MGPPSRNEWIMAALVLLAMFFWICGSNPNISLPLLGSNFINATRVVFVVISLATQDWTPPQTATGWAALAGISVAMPIAILGIFISTGRVGPFRTALVMNLEPLLGTLGAVIFLGDAFGPVQALGGAIMLAALVAFQLRR